ncbi:unnamed protein product [Brassica oleracea]
MHSRRNTNALSASRCSDAWLVAFGAVCLRGNAPPHAAATPSPRPSLLDCKRCVSRCKCSCAA